MTSSVCARAVQRAVACLAMTLALLSVVPAAPAHATITSPERQMMININNARLARGLRALSYSSSLSDLARVHSRAMAASGTLFHTSNLARTLRAYSWSTAGENVGYGSSITSIFNAFMASPAHRANNLYTRFNRIGTGVVSSGSRLYVTVQFLG